MIEITGLTKRYDNGTLALEDVHVTIPDGQFVVVVGLSGAGKSTFLRSINRLVEPTSGSIKIDGTDVLRLKGRELRLMRSQIGMIFQNFNLVKRSTVLRNVLAGRLAQLDPWRGLFGLFPDEDIAIALQALDRVGLREKALTRADQLSGGQQQRVGIARALCQKPKVILADEPVASLDPPTSRMVMDDLRRINREDGITTLVNLHFIDLAREYADRLIGLRAGRLVYDGPGGDVPDEVFEDIYGRNLTEDDLRLAGANVTKADEA